MENNLFLLDQFLTRYRWNGRFHGRVLASGEGPYLEDSMENGFPFISHLEEKGRHFLQTGLSNEHEAQTFILEIIQWGGAQRGLDSRFMRGMNSQKDCMLACRILFEIARMLSGCTPENPSPFISKAMNLPSIGLTYGSKILRFLNPDIFPAIDLRIEGTFGNGNDSVLGRTQPRSVRRYAEWYRYIHKIKSGLNGSLHPCDHKPWTAARIEMALFQFATEELKKKSSDLQLSQKRTDSFSPIAYNEVEDDGAFITLGGKHKPFYVRPTKSGFFSITTAWESGRVFELDRRKILDLVNHFKTQGWFSLANDVVKIRKGTEDKNGLGVYVVERLKLFGTDASQIAAWLVGCGALEWNGRERGIRFRVIENWDGTL